MCLWPSLIVFALRPALADADFDLPAARAFARLTGVIRSVAASDRSIVRRAFRPGRSAARFPVSRAARIRGAIVSGAGVAAGPVVSGGVEAGGVGGVGA